MIRLNHRKGTILLYIKPQKRQAIITINHNRRALTLALTLALQLPLMLIRLD